MSDKEVNQLKRGRMQRLAREQKKSSSVGEITDPFIVLNDSISVKNRPQDTDSGDYIPSESKNSAKTTSVDEPDPLLDLSEEPEIAKSAPNNRRNRPPHTLRDSRYTDSKCHYSGKREESRGEFRGEPREESSSMRLKSDAEFPSRPRSGEKSCSREKTCSCLGAVRHFFGKIMKVLGLKPAGQSCCSQRNCPPKTKPTDANERPPSNASQNIHRKNYGHGRPRHQTPRKFQ
ncbi:MAG: hypothetical protein LBG09_01155 [Puniceicoccales bacterium]|jgi:hypothetical protein|nr:hypothetical protein [Puniceicoccales bacterium]